MPIEPLTEVSHTCTWIDRGWYIVTEFERTRSINFQRAVDLAETHPEFTPLMDERNVLIYRNIYRKEDLAQFQAMYRIIKNWKGAKLYINGERVAYDTIGLGIHCYVQTVLSGDKQAATSEACHRFLPKESCPISGCIGCRRSHVSMQWQGRPSPDIPVWFAFGSLDHHHVYHLHVEHLESAAMSELLDYHFCPLLDIEKIQQFIYTLPRKIDPRKDREWQYSRKHNTSHPPLVAGPQFDQRAANEPAVLPISEEAYEAYLRRKGV